MKRKRPAAVVVLAGLFAIGAIWVALGPGTSTPVHATTATVNIGNNWFSNSTSNNCGSPCVTNIGVGDTVHWVWIGSNNHSSTSDMSSTEVWDSGEHGMGNTFDQTFNSPGSYNYHCTVHASMHGTIVVGPTPTPTNTNTPTNTRTPTSTFTVGPSPTPTNTPSAPTETATATETGTAASPTVTPPGPTVSATYTPTFTLTLTPVTTPTPAGLVGDANKDGHVDSIDAAIVLQYSAGLVPYINPHADANQNGEINAIDATLILQYVAGLVSHLPP